MGRTLAVAAQTPRLWFLFVTWTGNSVLQVDRWGVEICNVGKGMKMWRIKELDQRMILVDVFYNSFIYVYRLEYTNI